MTTTSERIDARPEEWKDSALCAQADPDEWFPERTSPTAAIATCRRCPVATECLESALRDDERYGIWGGLLPHQREEIRKERGVKRGVTEAELVRQRKQADRLLPQYEARIANQGHARDLAAMLEISIDALAKRMQMARRRRDAK
jgi:WhiB family redox-sensing transcriptional regulator